jgi:hypothetical protein
MYDHGRSVPQGDREVAQSDEEKIRMRALESLRNLNGREGALGGRLRPRRLPTARGRAVSSPALPPVEGLHVAFHGR